MVEMEAILRALLACRNNSGNGIAVPFDYLFSCLVALSLQRVVIPK